MASFAHFPSSVLSALPDDPAHAMVELEARMARHLGWSAARTREYIEAICLWNDEHSLGLELGEVRRAVDLNGKLDALQYEIGRFRQRLRRERLRRSVSGGNPDRVELALEPIEFTHKETREILQHLRNIKQIVENSSLFLGRKEAVLSRIIALLFYTSELNNDDNVNFESPELTENNF